MLSAGCRGPNYLLVLEGSVVVVLRGTDLFAAKTQNEDLPQW